LVRYVDRWNHRFDSTRRSAARSLARADHVVKDRVAFKYRLIRTPLQEPAIRLRGVIERVRIRITKPELLELYLEGDRVRAAMTRLLAPDTNCIDIGCHYGSVLGSIVRRAPRGRHMAFEPTPDKVRFLRRKFPDVEIREVALSDNDGETTFWVNTKAAGFNSLQRSGDSDVSALTVKCARLDDVVATDRTFGFVKIDVEGAELLVLRGGAAFLRRDRPYVLFECGPEGPSAFGFESADLYRFVRSLDYDIYTAHAWLESQRPVDEAAFLRALEYPCQAFNWLAVPATR
jgi:FkbM family methyltransferase